MFSLSCRIHTNRVIGREIVTLYCKNTKYDSSSSFGTQYSYSNNNNHNGNNDNTLELYLSFDD